MKILKRYAFHPLLIAGYAVLALMASNIDQINAHDGLRPLLICLILSAIFWLVLRLMIRDWLRSAIIATFLIALFFTYGHVYHFLRSHPILGVSFGRHRILLTFWAVLAIVGVWWLLGKKRDIQIINVWLNATLAIALFFSIVQITLYETHLSAGMSKPVELSSDLKSLHLPEGQSPPDVYLIILDAYARADLLNSVYHFDNTPFLNSLTDMGFYVAPCSMSNYTMSDLSLSAMLNLDYLNTLGDFSSDSKDRTPLHPLLINNAVRQTLERLGYKFVAFESDYFLTQFTDADVYLSVFNSGNQPALTGFESMLISTSAGLVFTDATLAFPFLNINIPELSFARRRADVLYTLETLPDVPQDISGPKFVFAHIMIPHPFFIFGPNGEAITPSPSLSLDQQKAGYVGQMEFINSHILPVLQAIIERSETPPIIILMGDHGPREVFDEGMLENMISAYLPNGGELYPTISPVNIFRVIFDDYFGGNFSILDDLYYFSPIETPFDFHLAVNRCSE